MTAKVSWAAWLVATLLALALPAARAVAQQSVAGGGIPDPGASAVAHTPQGDVRLISAVRAVGDAAAVRLGLHFRLEPHWKIYWRAPGDAGYPPTLDWRDSVNLKDATVSWPGPARFSLQGIETAGYEGEVVLPLVATLAEPGRPLAAKVAVDFLVCSEICVPQHADLALSLPAGPATPSRFGHLIDRFAARVPGDGAAAGLTLVEAALERSSGGTFLRLALDSTPAPFTAPDLFVEGPEGLAVGAPVATLDGGGRRAVLRAPVRAEPKGGLGAGPVTVTVVDGDRALERTTTLTASAAAPQPGAAGLLAMLAVAALGGLLLNVMPCVLPVLSLKILGAMGHGGAERRHARIGFLASAAGIVASFLALAAVAAIARQAGGAVGWGIQFQQPLFLIAMSLLLALFAANLWGWYEIAMPAMFGRLGGGGRQGHSLAGAFATGAFATLLATPCSAPFVGTAVAFALSRGPVEIVAIFASLGLGMALPYLLVAAFPGLAVRLPRPGRWMARVKKGLGLALAGTAAWLVTVLSAQIGSQSAATVAGLLVAMLATLSVRRRLPRALRPAGAMVVLLLGGLAFVQTGNADHARAAPVLPNARWLTFDATAIAGQVAAGRTVLVDVTADWCVTCQVNKAAVLNRGAVAARLEDGATVAMRADWTRPDEAIAAYLARHGRYGIPFNAVYGPAAPEGVVLPELLTEQAVIEALDRAAGK